REQVCATICGTPIAVTEFYYDNPNTSGNLTQQFKWDDQKSGVIPQGSLSVSNSQVLNRAYDTAGNLTDIYAPEIRTKISYGSILGASGPGPYPTSVQYAYGTIYQRT